MRCSSMSALWIFFIIAYNYDLIWFDVIHSLYITMTLFWGWTEHVQFVLGTRRIQWTCHHVKILHGAAWCVLYETVSYRHLVAYLGVTHAFIVWCCPYWWRLGNKDYCHLISSFHFILYYGEDILCTGRGDLNFRLPFRIAWSHGIQLWRLKARDDKHADRDADTFLPEVKQTRAKEKQKIKNGGDYETITKCCGNYACKYPIYWSESYIRQNQVEW